MSSQRGFTLLEILIAVAILAFITAFTAQSIGTALRNRTKIQKEIDQVGSVREALKVMENDINRAFNFRDINIALYNETAKERNKKIEAAKAKGTPPPATPPGGTPPAGGAPPPTPDPYANMEPLKLKEEKVLTQFMGEADRLDFTALANARISSEERTSDQAEVGYTLGECKSRKERGKSSRCLMRRISPFIDDDVTEGGESTALLENVTRLEFRYLGGEDTTEWKKTWLTNERADEKNKGIFPNAVEVTIEVQNTEDKSGKPTRMTLVASVRNPNNPPPKADPALGEEGATAQ